jgi:hypothetical protein
MTTATSYPASTLVYIEEYNGWFEYLNSDILTDRNGRMTVPHSLCIRGKNIDSQRIDVTNARITAAPPMTNELGAQLDAVLAELDADNTKEEARLERKRAYKRAYDARQRALKNGEKIIDVSARINTHGFATPDVVKYVNGIRQATKAEVAAFTAGRKATLKRSTTTRTYQ